ncbi:MAG: hypothetical protein L6Q66_03355 [Bacteroidia bacterium]|nr:hypothetical protein [Bacteroidia bacterium]
MTYKALEKTSFYNLFSSFMPTYENVDGAIGQVNKPFVKITDQGYEIMDAAHYAYIKENSYNVSPENEETKYDIAFFPLFPLIWKFFSNFGIVVLNFLFFITSIILLASIFCKDSLQKAMLISLALPTLTVFLLPYTEGLFLFCISLSLWGYKKENKKIYFIGLLLASITRPVFLLFICAAIATSIYELIKGKKINLKFLLLTCSPFIIGTLSVAAYQSFYHDGSFFAFMSSQKHWGTYFRIPDTVNDWSNEGYGMNSWALIFFSVFGILILVYNLISKSYNSEKKYPFWYNFSWIYLLATCCYVILFQGGCLHSLYRYTICSPFSFILIFYHLEDTSSISKKYILFITSLFVITTILFFKNVDYSANWDFSKMGFVLLMTNLFIYLIRQYLNNRLFFTIYFALILAGILWNTYLYNMFFSKAWIFL